METQEKDPRPSSDPSSISQDQQQQVLFMMLIQQHQQIAMMGLGELENPATGAKERDLSSAKYAIDTLIMLERFTKGNITSDLSAYLSSILTDLRLRFAGTSS
jgi:hypothetical protein